MFPFQKIFTLLIRTFSRPMLGYVKRKQIEKPGSRFASFFVGVGRRAHVFENWVNHRILKTAKKRHVSELKDEVLLEKGIEFFYEWLFYIIVLGLPFWELYRSSAAAVTKEQNLQKRIANLQRKLGQINEKIGKIVEYAKEKSKEDQVRVKRAQLKDINLNERKQIKAKMADMGEATVSQEGENISEKIEEIFQNAIEVMADQFQDSLDDLEFPTGDGGGSDLEVIDEPADSDADIGSIQAQGQSGSSDLLEDIAAGDSSGPQIDVGDTDVQVDAGVDVDVDSSGDSAQVSVGE